METVKKIGVKVIEITRAEGLSKLCGIKHSFKSFERADIHLATQSSTFPKEGGYDKHDFHVEFEDGETYDGRMDCRHPSCANADLQVRKHIRDHVQFCTGEHRPYHLTEEQYKQALRGIETQEYKDLLEKYDI